MKSTFVSTAAISQALRYSLLRMQSDLTKASKEATTGRVADVGLALGARTGYSVSLGRDVDRLKGIVDTNGLASSRLSATQDALTQITTAAQSFLSTLTTSSSGDSTPSIVRAKAEDALRSFTSILNTSYNGEYVFAGINTDVKPINDFLDPSSPNKAAFDTAFSTYFGFTQNDAQAANITATQMGDFLTTVVEPQFLGAGWQGSWSNATDEGITSRIALNESTETSVSANDQGLRKMALAAASVYAIYNSNVGEDGRQAVLSFAVGVLGQSVAGIADLSAKTGIIENRVKNATDRINMQVDLFNKNILDIEGVDPYEAANRVSLLQQQIETSYALTARMQQLSLVKYLT
jgi:flagellar hook-associated protein 3 FlgL